MILVALASLILAGLAAFMRTPSRPFSTVFAQFEPADLVWPRAGYTVHDTHVRGGGTFNTARGHGYREWHGFIEARDDPALRERILRAIDAYIKRESRGKYDNTDWTGAPDYHLDARIPRHTRITFNQGKWHGDMRIRLFPDSSGADVGYAIFLREDLNR